MPSGYLASMALKRTIRAETNPMDKSTVISIYPQAIDEVKVTIQPGRFHIDAGSYEKPSLLVVGPSSWWKEIDEDQPLLEITNGSLQVADSIVRDYCNGLYCCNMNDVMPGIFWLPGEIDLVALRMKHKDKLDKVNQNQIRYFSALVKAADTMWARTGGNPLAISSEMRTAARMLNLTDKEWMRDHLMLGNSKCPACATMISPAVIVCPNCKVIVDPKRFAEMKMQFAG